MRLTVGACRMACVAAAVAALVTLGDAPVGRPQEASAAGPAGPTGGREAAPSYPAAPAQLRFAVGIRTVRFTDWSRMIHLPGGRTVPRELFTYVRYPAVGPSGGPDLPGAPPAPGPFPLVVFAHGFAITPAPYASLLRRWASAGYVVASPVFPLENANAPGGPDESDLVNEPRDISFLITRLLAPASLGSSSLAGLLIDPSRIAVSGQSDGGEAALAVAFGRRVRDRRIGAAIVLSGGELPGVGGFAYAPGGPALLAVQGTADTINEPRFTYSYFTAARRPKYLLRLLGAGHLPPYTYQQPQLTIVADSTTAFLDAYLKRTAGSAERLLKAGTVPRAAAIRSEP